jgi:hypothetical protein
MRQFRANLPAIGLPGGPCHVIRNIEEAPRLNPPTRAQLIQHIERGGEISNLEADAVYPRIELPLKRVDFADRLELTSHAQYRMNLRGVTIPDVQGALSNFGRWYAARKAQGTRSLKKDEVSLLTDLASGSPVRFDDTKTGVTLIFAKKDTKLTLVSSWWTNEPNPPKPKPGECAVIPFFDQRGQKKPRILGSACLQSVVMAYGEKRLQGAADPRPSADARRYTPQSKQSDCTMMSFFHPRSKSARKVARGFVRRLAMSDAPITWKSIPLSAYTPKRDHHTYYKNDFQEEFEHMWKTLRAYAKPKGKAGGLTIKMSSKPDRKGKFAGQTIRSLLDIRLSLHKELPTFVITLEETVETYGGESYYALKVSHQYQGRTRPFAEYSAQRSKTSEMFTSLWRDMHEDFSLYPMVVALSNADFPKRFQQDTGQSVVEDMSVAPYTNKVSLNMQGNKGINLSVVLNDQDHTCEFTLTFHSNQGQYMEYKGDTYADVMDNLQEEHDSSLVLFTDKKALARFKKELVSILGGQVFDDTVGERAYFAREGIVTVVSSDTFFGGNSGHDLDFKITFTDEPSYFKIQSNLKARRSVLEIPLDTKSLAAGVEYRPENGFNLKEWLDIVRVNRLNTHVAKYIASQILKSLKDEITDGHVFMGQDYSNPYVSFKENRGKIFAVLHDIYSIEITGILDIKSASEDLAAALRRLYTTPLVVDL